jgi:hypothetical protein
MKDRIALPVTYIQPFINGFGTVLNAYTTRYLA